MLGTSFNFSVTAIKNRSGNFTAFFDELPGLVVQAKDDKEMIDKLDSLLKSYAKRLQSADKNFDIKIKDLV